jgi:peptidoglycan hydrolase-like protein with peptidoglycan-binding domain
LIDFAKPNEVRRIQQRLIELGYLDRAADGKWGPRSRHALQEFRTAMAIGAGDSWDEQTQQQLFSHLAERSAAISQIVSRNPTAAGQQPGACWIPTNDDLGVGYWGACSDKGSRPFK